MTAEAIASAAELALKLSPLPAWATTLGIPVVKKLITEFPHLKADIVALFQKDDVTVEDWDLFKARVAAAEYEKLVPHSGLIPTAEKPAVLGEGNY